METGKVPNIYWQALLVSQLRQLHNFEALPPVETILLAGNPSYRYVRQDDPLWSRLHSGILTTGYLASALGFYEPESAKRLGLNRDAVSHSNLLRVYRHLQQQVYQPAVNPNISAEAASAHNAAAVTRYNEENSKAVAEVMARNGAGKRKEGSTVVMVAAGQAQHALPSCSTSSKKKKKKKKCKGKGDTCLEHHQGQQQEPLSSDPHRVICTNPSIINPDLNQFELDSPNEQDAFLLETLALKTSRFAASQGLSAVRCAWGSAQEAASLLALAAASPTSRVVECGLCAITAEDLPTDWGFCSGSLPGLGASPDAIIRHSEQQPTIIHSLGAENEDGEGAESNNNSTCQKSTAAMLATGTSINGAVPAEHYWEEIVEVKNTCPFGPAPRSGSRSKHGQAKQRYAVTHRGPRGEVLPIWIPQLQLHMLCAGTASGLLVSRSATRGMRIFRIPRDDAYLQLMLGLVSKFWREHVCTGKPPGKGEVWRWQGHAELVQRSRSIARNAEVVGLVEENILEKFGDGRFFLE